MNINNQVLLEKPRGEDNRQQYTGSINSSNDEDWNYYIRANNV